MQKEMVLENAQNFPWITMCHMRDYLISTKAFVVQVPKSIQEAITIVI